MSSGSRGLKLVFLAFTVFSCISVKASAAIDTKVNTRAELLQALQSAKPGTKILLAPGEYKGGISAADLRGRENEPIILDALDPDRPPVIRGAAFGIQLTDPAYVELRNLVISGCSSNGINIDDGGSMRTPAHHIVLHSLKIHDIGPKGNSDGIKLSGVDDFTIKGCEIGQWGNGGGSAIDMVGCHRGTIKECVCKFRSDADSTGIQAKGGTANILIQQCRFEYSGSRAINIGGSTGLQFFRPQGVNYEAKDITVEDNTFIGSLAPIAFVGVDGAIVRYNTFYQPAKWVARILQETRDTNFLPCQNGVFSNNLVVWRAKDVQTTINVGSGTDAESFRFEKNAWFCVDAPERSAQLQLPSKEKNGIYGVNPLFVAVAELDLRLSDKSPILDAGARTPKK